MGRRPNRFLLSRRNRTARKAEAFIFEYEFPAHIRRRVQRRWPQIDDSAWKAVERGLREWFVCCAWRGRTILGMPSKAVDDAWHEFILDSIAYTAFCNVAFGSYLHHTPDEAMSGSMVDALANTVRAWDRSDAGSDGESVLWDLDEHLGLAEPLGIDGLRLAAARTGAPALGMAGACVGWSDVGGHHGGDGGGCSGGGCSGGCGSGCGGGGCGGGGS